MSIKLRDGLLWFRDAPLTNDANTTWPNIGRQLHPSPASAGGSAVYSAGVGWVFSGSGAEFLTVDHHVALNPDVDGSFAVFAKAFMRTSAATSATLLAKLLGNGWRIYRNGTLEQIAVQIIDASANTHFIAGAISYDTDFVVCWRYTGGVSSLFVDGVLAGTDSSPALTNPIVHTGDLTMGASYTDANRWDGPLYEVAVFGEALTDAEVVSLSNDMASDRDELMIGPVWLDCPADVTFSGRSMGFTAVVYPGSFAESQAVKAQFAGMNPGDEIPIWWTGDPDVNGVYRLLDNIQTTPEGVWLEHGYMNARLSVERLSRQGNRGLIEQRQYRAVRTNTYSLTTADAWTRGTLAGTPQFVSADPSVLTTQNSDSGPVARHFVALNSGSLTNNMRYTRQPIDAYSGASQVEDLSGSTGRSSSVEVPTGGVVYPVVGTDLTVDTARDVRITNGLVRFWASWDLSGLYCQRWAPETQWGATHKITFVMGGNAVTFADTAPRVLTNDPLETVVVFGLTGTGIAGWEMALRLRRGCVVGEFNMAGVSSETLVVTLDSGATTVAIAGTFGACIKSDAADSSGWFGHLMAPNLVGSASTAGVITLPAGTDVNVGFGIGTDTTAPANEYFCAESFTEWHA